MPTHRVLLVAVTAAGTVILSGAQSAADPGGAALTDDQRQEIVTQFATAFVHDDHAGIAARTTPDITWTVPGAGKISGVTSGRDGVIGLADTLKEYDVQITVQAITFGLDTVAVELHDAGDHNGRELNQNVVNVLSIRDGRIASVASHLADIASFDAYFS